MNAATVSRNLALLHLATGAALLAVAVACGPKVARVTLTVDELRTLEACVIGADEQVERQNCVERFIPPAGR